MTTLTIKPNTLDPLDDEEKKTVQWIKAWYEDPMANGGFLETLQDCGGDMIRDLLSFLERYGDAHRELLRANPSFGDLLRNGIFLDKD